MEKLTQIIEALIFSAGKSISRDDILSMLNNIKVHELDNSINELKLKYSGDSGILLLTFNDKYQFSSNTMYGDVIADCLLPLKEKELSKTLLEVLAIIAYKQPITKLEIEEIRGVNSEYSTQMLSKLNLITVCGRKDAIGRPSLYATTDDFLKRFELNSLDNLPNYESLLDRIRLLDENDSHTPINLYKKVKVNVEDSEIIEDEQLEIANMLIDEENIEIIEIS